MEGQPRLDYAALFDAVPTACLVLTPDLVIVASNGARRKVTGRSHDDVAGRHLFDAFPDNPDDPEATGVHNLNASLLRALTTREPDRMAVQRYDIRSGSDGAFVERYWSPVNIPVLDDGGRVTYLLHVVEDVTEAVYAQREADARDLRFRQLVEHASDVIILVGSDGRMRYVSPAATTVFGADAASLQDLDWRDVADGDHRTTAADLLERAMGRKAGETIGAVLRVTAADGVHWVQVQATNHLATPAVGGIVMNARDVTDQREAERTLAVMALQDPLTGLANRRAFLGAVERGLARTARTGRSTAVILFDLDHFKAVNDTLGHAAGDQLLIRLSEGIREVLRPSDVLARFGGDEFAVFAEDLTEHDDAAVIADRILAAGRGLVQADPLTNGRVSLSIGVAAGVDATDPGALLRQADAALYRAKAGGRDRVGVFGADLRAQQARRRSLAGELDAALTRDEIVLHWQPVADAAGGGVVGAEALVRWNHPRRGLILPHDFLPIAEQSGHMAGLSARILALAIGQAAAWRDDASVSGAASPHVFINLSAAQLADPALTEQLTLLATSRQVPPAQLRLDVSEGLLGDGPPRTVEQIEALHDSGFGVALDDFGANGSALSWLERLPLAVLKLDQRFAAATDDSATEAVVRAIVGLAAALGITVLAEGVESSTQRAAMSRLGCQLLQGFHIARPGEAAAVTSQLVGSGR